MKPMLRALSTSAARWRPWLTAAALVTGALLGGCTGNSLGGTIPAGVGGLPADTPAPLAAPPDYPAVHDMPPPRAVRMLDDDQQQRLQKDLIRVRDRQEKRNPNAKKPANAGTDQ